MSVLIGLSLVSCQPAETDNLTPATICTLVQEGYYVRGIEDCSIYYQCVKGEPVQKSCPEGHVFDKERTVCVPSNICDPAAERKCITKVNGFISDSQSCAGYFFCEGGKVFGRGVCPEKQKFDGGSCVWSDENEECIRETSICDYIKSGEFFGSADDCSAWRKCTNGQIDKGTCGEFQFDLNDATCTYKSDCRQEAVNAEIPSTKPPPPTACAVGSPEFMKDGSTCGGFYYCKGDETKGVWGQCARNRFFDGNNCVDRTSVVCTKDRCEGMGKGVTWVNIAGDGCVGYNFCEDGGLMVGQKGGKCKGWFDEKLQKCVSTEVKYTACAKEESLSTTTQKTTETTASAEVTDPVTDP